MAQLLIDSRDLTEVEKRALAAFPAECCGLLLGTPQGDRKARIGRVEPCVNQARDQLRRFTISPDELMAAYRSARERGEKVVGTYHSHPQGTAVPSDIDRESAWPGASYLIVGLGADGIGERRSWRLEQDRFIEEELIVRQFEDGEEEA